MKTFSSPDQVENFLLEKGILFRKGYCEQPLKKEKVTFYQVKVGKSYCDVHDIVSWANVLYSGRSLRSNTFLR